MTISYGSNPIFGLSGDTKPANVPKNSTFMETDTLARFLFDGTVWNEFSSGTGPILFQDDYSDPIPWTQVGTTVTVDDPGFPNVLKFNTTPNGGVDRRVHRSLGLTLSDTAWIYEFTMNIQAILTPSHVIAAFSAGTLAVLDGLQDSVGLVYNDVPTAGLLLFSKDGAGALNVSTRLDLPVGLYYMRLQRSAGINLAVTAFSDMARTIPIGSTALVIPATVTTLNTLQHGNNNTDLGTASLSATVDDTVIF